MISAATKKIKKIKRKKKIQRKIQKKIKERNLLQVEISIHISIHIFIQYVYIHVYICTASARDNRQNIDSGGDSDYDVRGLRLQCKEWQGLLEANEGLLGQIIEEDVQTVIWRGKRKRSRKVKSFEYQVWEEDIDGMYTYVSQMYRIYL